MSNKFLLLQLLLLLLLLLGLIHDSNAKAQQMRLRLPPSYNMRLGSVPPRFVGKGAYTLAGKRTSPSNGNNKWQQQLQAQVAHQQQQQLKAQAAQQQQQHQLQAQQQQQQQRMQLFQWATMGGKKYN